jgi:hypothetical protein
MTGNISQHGDRIARPPLIQKLPEHTFQPAGIVRLQQQSAFGANGDCIAIGQSDDFPSGLGRCGACTRQAKGSNRC